MSGRTKLFAIIICILTALCVFTVNGYAETAKEFYEKAREAFKNRKYDQGIGYADKAIQLDQNIADFYTLRGGLYRMKKEFTQSIYDYSKAIKLNPDDARNYYFRAIIYTFTKDYDKAWDDVHKAQSLGFAILPGFIEELQKASGRKE